jgi:beta-N-acetylhexosaminidase
MTDSLEAKIGQMLVVGFEGLEPPGYLLEWLAEGRIGGVILFARNVASPAQVAELTQACHAAAIHPLMIAIDQEGGVVSRLRGEFTESPGAMPLAAAGSEELAEDVSAVLGAEMRVWDQLESGSVLDLTHNIHNPSVGVRSWAPIHQLPRDWGGAGARLPESGRGGDSETFPRQSQHPD